METLLSQLDELTASWHWEAFQCSGLIGLKERITDFFTSIQEHHRIEVVATNLTTVQIDGENCHSALVTFKRYDKPGVKYAP